MLHAFVAVILALAPVVSHEQDARKHGKPRSELRQARPGSQNPNYPQRAAEVGAYKVP